MRFVAAVAKDFHKDPPKRSLSKNFRQRRHWW